MKKLILPIVAASLPATLSAQLVINELLFDPAPENDVNGDGVANTSDDEFIEIVNTGDTAVDIGNYTITDATPNTFTFPAGTMLGSNEAVLIFGGGNPPATINGAAVFIGAPSLNNSSDTITLFDASMTQLDQVAWTDRLIAEDQSYNRSPELVGDFAAHSTIVGAVGTESPGTDVTGASFGNPLPTLTLSPETSTISESGAMNTVTLTVTLAEDPDSYPATITLSSDDTTEATVPASVELTSGTSVTFTVTGVDDPNPDGDQDVTITASTSGFRADTATVTVTDDGDVGNPSSSALLITQYHEGFSNNKYVELTNVSNAPVDLSGYIITRWTNASAEDFKIEGNLPSDETPLSGTLPAGASFVIANGSAAVPISAGSANLISGITNFNGDDSVVLYQGTTGSTANIADAVSFTDLGSEGTNKGFVRQNDLIGHNLDTGSTVLDFPGVWQEISVGEVDSATLGQDAFIGSSALGTNSPLIALVETSAVANEADGMIEVVVEILNPDGEPVAVDLVFDDANSSASLADIGNFATQTVTFPAGAASGDTMTITVNLTDDTDEESAESAIFNLANLVTVGGAQLGGGSTFTLSLQDNDTVVPPIFFSEIADPGDEFSGRFVELYNPTSEAVDLAAGDWNIVYFSNDNSSGTSVPLTGTIPAMGTYIVATDLEAYAMFYPDAPAPDQESDTINSNGDDNYELRIGGGENVGALIDIYGMPGTDGTGESWEFLDSRVDRVANAPNATFTIEEWTITPANVAEMTPGVFGGGGPVTGDAVEVVDFSVDASAGRATLVVKGLGAKIFVLQSSSDLDQGDAWAEVAGGFSESDNPDGSTNLGFTYNPAAQGKLFYRLIEQR